MVTLDALRGRIVDADSHEFIPANHWAEQFGDAGSMLSAMMLSQSAVTDVQSVGDFVMHVERDETEITSGSIWLREGWDGAMPKAPGAIDMDRRIEVLDAMGVARQLVFPSFGLLGLILSTSSINWLEQAFGGFPPGTTPELIRGAGHAVCAAWNEWAGAHQRAHPDRLQIAGVVNPLDFDQMMRETEQHIAQGVRAFWLPTSIPPGGMSPADPAVDPFWRLCEESGTTIYLHLAFEEFMSTSVWRETPIFTMESIQSAEFIVDPWSCSTSHMSAENYLTTTILGGVFERFPALRMGAIEYGAFWLGPMAENLDRYANMFRRRLATTLSMPPSEYLRRNVRATPFCFEPVATYVERHPVLADVLCYGSDYPHIEGGRDQLNRFAAAVEPLGEGFAEKFFVSNSEQIMPSLSVRA